MMIKNAKGVDDDLKCREKNIIDRDKDKENEKY